MSRVVIVEDRRTSPLGEELNISVMIESGSQPHNIRSAMYGTCSTDTHTVGKQRACNCSKIYSVTSFVQECFSVLESNVLTSHTFKYLVDLTEGAIKQNHIFWMESILFQCIAVPHDIAVVRYSMAMEREDTQYTSSLVRCASVVSPANLINI